MCVIEYGMLRRSYDFDGRYWNIPRDHNVKNVARKIKKIPEHLAATSEMRIDVYDSKCVPLHRSVTRYTDLLPKNTSCSLESN